MSGKLTRSLSMALTVSMMGTFVPNIVLAEDTPTVWDAARITELTDEECEKGVIYLGTQTAPAEERGRYVLTIYRDGNTDGDAEITLGTIDASASYGEDYEIVGQDTVYHDLGGTVFERNADTDTEETISNYIDTVDMLRSENEDSSSEDETDSSDTPEKSNLAKIKEAETGMETRELSGSSESGANFLTGIFEQYDNAVSQTEGDVNSEEILRYTHDNLSDYAETSSDTVIKFATGETEKQIEIDVLEDKQSEADEAVVFLLSSPSGARVGDLSTCTMTITDNDEYEESYLSFESEKASLKGGDNKLRLIRSGADYRMVSATITLSDGDTKEVYLKPYQTELEVEMSLSGSGSETATLSDFKACSAGDVTECEITFEDESETENMDTVTVAADGVSESTLSFYLAEGISAHNSNVKLRVDYVPGQYENETIDLPDIGNSYTINKLYGNIVDESYDPEVVVGRYYFPEDFEYGLFTGDDVSGRKSEYKKTSNDDFPDGYGYLYWYKGVCWKEGSSYAVLNDVPMHRYKSIGIDWEQTSEGGEEQRSYFELFREIPHYRKGAASMYDTVESGELLIRDQSFERKISVLGTKFADNDTYPADGVYDYKGKIEVTAADFSSGRCPKIEIKFYGAACMYRTFNISLANPAKLSFVEGSETRSETPCAPTLGNGHEVRYYGQTLSINSNPNNQGGIVEGELIAYRIDINHKISDSAKKATIYYVANGHTLSESTVTPVDGANVITAADGADLANIKVDDDFVNMIDSSCGYANSTSASNWATDLQFTPIYKYKDVTVQIMESDTGTFTDLAAGKHTYHVGDKLELIGLPKSEAYEFAGYQIEGYATENNNETPLINCTEHSDNAQALYLTLGENNCTFYKLKPIFEEKSGNYIRLEKSDGYDNLTVSNLLTDEQIATIMAADASYSLAAGDLIYIANPDAASETDVTEAQRLIDMITVEDGKVYQIEAYGTDVVPTFKNDSNYSTETVTTRVLDFVASDKLEENIITVGSTERKASDEKLMRIDGKIISAEYSVRQSSETVREDGAQGMNVYSSGVVGDMWITASGSDTKTKAKYIERPNAQTDDSGNFSISGISAAEGDCITVYYSNGDVEGVKLIKLCNYTPQSATISYTRGKTNDTDKTNSSETVSAEGLVYDISSDKIVTPVFTTGSPYVTEITYKYDSAANNAEYPQSENAVAICDDYFTVIADVNPNGRTVKKVVFTLDKVKSADQTFTCNAYVGQTQFECNFDGKSMDKIFEPGDRLYITLYDEENQVVYMTAEDENGNTYYEKVEKEKAYTRVYTGLSFYVPMTDAKLQVFEVEDLGASLNLDLPLVGRTMTTSNSGVLSFTKTNWPDSSGADGYSVTFDMNASIAGYSSKTSQEVFDAVKQMDDDAYDTAATDALANFLNDTPEESNLNKLYNEGFKKSLNDTLGKKLFKLNVIVLLNFDFMYSDEMGEYIFVSGQVAYGGTFSVAKTFYTSIYGVPLYLQISGSLSVQLQANYQVGGNLTSDEFNEAENIKNALPESDVGLFLMLTGKIQAGVGICGVLGARGIVNVKTLTFISFMHDPSTHSGVVATFGGGLGIDLLLFSIEYAPDIYTIGCGIYKDMTGLHIGSEAEAQDISIENMLNDGTLRIYNTGNGGQVGGDGISAVEMTDYTVLLSDAPERTRPQIINLDDGRKMLVYIGANTERGYDLNKPCLYYSIYDGTTWSEAQPVEDDGTADSTPKIAKYGDDVIIAWADASREFTEDDSNKTALSLFDISAVRFDTETNTPGDVFRISNDSETYGQNFMDYSPILCSDAAGERGVALYYVKRDVMQATADSTLADPNSVYETIAMTFWDAENGIITEQFPSIDGDPYLINFSGKFMDIPVNGTTHSFAVCAYTAARDNDITDNSKWDTYLMFHDITDNVTYKPINLCSDYIADTKPQLTRLGDDVYLTWISQTDTAESDSAVSKLNAFSVSDMLTLMQTGEENSDGSTAYSVDLAKVFNGDGENSEWYKKTAEELGLTDEQYSGSIYESLAENYFGIFDVTLSADRDHDTAFTNYKLLKGNDGNTYLVWTDSGSTDYDDYSIELYGAVRYNADDAPEGESGWSKAVRITDFSESTPNTVIDEFDATVDTDGTFDLVSNMFTQNTTTSGMEYSENKLIEFTFDNSAAPAIEDAVFTDRYPTIGDDASLVVTVKNDGLLRMDGYSVTVAIDGTEISSVETDEPLLGGCENDVTLTGTIPDTAAVDSTVTVTVTDSNGKTATYEMKLPVSAHIEFSDGKLGEDADGNLVYTVTATNSGNIASGDFNIETRRYNGTEEGGVNENATVVSASSLAPKESRKETITLESATLSKENFGEYGLAELNMKAVASDESEIGNNSLRIVSEAYKQRITVNGKIQSLTITKDVATKLESIKTPSYGSEQYTYSIDDSSVATIDQTGVITGHTAGTTQMTVTEASSGMSETFTVNVTEAEETPTETPTAAPTKKPSRSGGGGSSHTFSATPTPTPTPTATTAPADTEGLPFDDVSTSDWFYDSVKYVYDNGLMNGVSDTEFEPNAPLTRGMLVTVLGRAENVDTTAGGNGGFDDVAADAYYAPYVAWAKANGIVDGMDDETFAPDEFVTREQTAKILLGYYTYKGEGPQGAWAIRLDYTDLDKVSDWASEGVMFCAMQGLMEGRDDNTFDPQASISRSEAAAVMTRSRAGTK